MGNSMENMHTDIKVVKVKVESTRLPHKRMQRTYTLKKHYLVIGYSGRITIIILQAKNANTKKSTKISLKVWTTWAEERRIQSG